MSHTGYGEIMNFKQQLEALFNNLMALDGRKKIGLALGLVITLTASIFITAYFNKPVTAPLYSNLSREDLNSMSRVLSENGIEFVSLPETGAIEVKPSMTSHARMILAERGLPSSQESGYELFDRVNTLGLTSFMQDVTNKRAIEGELVRTIQMISGVNSARVHLVMADKNVFRRNRGAPPSASVVMKTYGKLPERSIHAIRHMVAAAVPGLESGNVTIVGADGSLMTSSDDSMIGSTKLVELEKKFEVDAENKISSALGAHLGGQNLRVSVTAKLNSDKRRIDETVFDPESRVERSVQVVREAGTTENTETASPTTIDQNLPDEDAPAGSGQSSSENSERREELTNYEINEKKISVVSDGYKIESVSVALVVNKTRLFELLGDNPDQAAIDAKVAELTGIVNSAISTSEERGDKVTVSLVEFMEVPDSELDAGGNPMMEFMAVHFGAMLNVIGLIVAALIFALLGLRPLLAFLSREPSVSAEETRLLAQATAATPQPGMLVAPSAVSGADRILASTNPQGSVAGTPAGLPAGAETAIGGQVNTSSEGEINLDQMAVHEEQVREKLENMISQSEDRAAMAIKHWLQEDQTSTA